MVQAHPTTFVSGPRCGLMHFVAKFHCAFPGKWSGQESNPRTEVGAAPSSRSTLRTRAASCNNIDARDLQESTSPDSAASIGPDACSGCGRNREAGSTAE